MEKSFSVPDELINSVTDDTNYTDTNKLGEGSYGEVYRIPASKNSRNARAVKISNRGTAGTILRREWKILSKLSHPNIVSVERNNFFTSPTRLYMVMEYVQGRDLLELLRAETCGESAAVHITRGILSALEYLHKNGVFHRDLKLENVLIGASAINQMHNKTSVKLCDFGLSKNRDSDDFTSWAGSVCYAAPEVFSSQITSRALADIFSFSVILYSICVNATPIHDSFFDDRKFLLALPAKLKELRKCKSGLFSNVLFRKIYRYSNCFDWRKRESARKLLSRKLYHTKLAGFCLPSPPLPPQNLSRTSSSLDTIDLSASETLTRDPSSDTKIA